MDYTTWSISRLDNEIMIINLGLSFERDSLDVDVVECMESMLTAMKCEIANR